MTIFSKGINAVASTNAGGTLFEITSTEEEKKKGLRVLITDIDTQPMLLDVIFEREKIVDALPLEVVSDLQPERVIELDVEIPIGQTLTGVLKPQVAGSQGTIDGWVEYEIL